MIRVLKNLIFILVIVICIQLSTMYAFGFEGAVDYRTLDITMTENGYAHITEMISIRVGERDAERVRDYLEEQSTNKILLLTFNIVGFFTNNILTKMLLIIPIIFSIYVLYIRDIRGVAKIKGYKERKVKEYNKETLSIDLISRSYILFQNTECLKVNIENYVRAIITILIYKGKLRLDKYLKKQMEKEGIIGKNNIVRIKLGRNYNLTEKGEELLDQIIGLRNYLNNIHILNDKIEYSKEKWDNYMIWAAFFGEEKNAKTYLRRLNSGYFTNQHQNIGYIIIRMYNSLDLY